MNNPYLVRVVYFALGVAVGTMFGCGSDGMNGRNGLPGNTGVPGMQGEQGTSGSNGANGGSCHVEQLDGGARIFCDDGSEAIIYDGKNGEDCEHGHHGHKK